MDIQRRKHLNQQKGNALSMRNNNVAGVSRLASELCEYYTENTKTQPHIALSVQKCVASIPNNFPHELIE